jgi:hypothetical protein
MKVSDNQPLFSGAPIMKVKSFAQIFVFTLSLIAFPIGGISINEAINHEAGSNLLSRVASEPAVKVQAASGDSIEFMTQNGSPIGEIAPQRLDLPHLVLYRNGELTNPDERTLNVGVSGIEVPSPGVTVTLKVETQHGDPDLGGGDGDRITVWQASQWLPNASTIALTNVTTSFEYTFNERIISGSRAIPTPTDYFRYEITVSDNDHTFADPLYTYSQEHAFLMENQWIAQLPEVQEESEGAAPDELVVYYCDMFPFRMKLFDKSTWLRREVIHDYVGTELLPAMAEAFRVQTDEWGFIWHEAWNSFRSGEDAERLSVALMDRRTWYHGRVVLVGHAGISINVKAVQLYGRVDYDSLTDKLMTVFQHELFHNLQRDISLHNGGDGDLDGSEGVWKFFSEGTAVLASTVGQTDMGFSQAMGAGAFLYKVDKTLMADIDESLAEMNPYQAALYWRFLYESCGGMKAGLEDPAAGMDIIRRVLNDLYSKEIVDIHTSSDLVAGMPAIMDQALADSACPFSTYEESLAAFAQAVYDLRPVSVVCLAPGEPAGCGKTVIN